MRDRGRQASRRNGTTRNDELFVDQFPFNLQNKIAFSFHSFLALSAAAAIRLVIAVTLPPDK